MGTQGLASYGSTGRFVSRLWWAVAPVLVLLALLDWLPPATAEDAPRSVFVGETEAAPRARETDRAYQPMLNDVRPSSFQGVTPGRTKYDDMVELLGKPIDSRQSDAHTTFTFRTGPFDNVEIDVVDDVVTSITLRLPNTSSVEKVEAELRLTAVSPAVVFDEHAQQLGVSYPERGVTLVFVDQQRRVGHVVLEQILAEPFVLRAEQDTRRRYTAQLADLEYAIKISSTSARAYGLLAQRRGALGQHAAGLEAIEQAIRFAPDVTAYRLTRAELLFDQLDYTQAVSEVAKVLENSAAPAIDRARAELLLGNLLAEGPHQESKQAMQHHMAAIRLATPLGTDRRFMVRRAAKRILMDAYLGAAKDVAAGDWQKKDTTIPKWLENAEKLAEGMRLHDGGDETLRFYVLRKSVAAYAELGGDVDVNAPIDVAVQEADRLLAATPDPLYGARLRRETAQLMFDASVYEMLRVPAAEARQRGNNAVALWEELNTAGHTTPRDEARMGRLYFYIGSTHAVHDRDHEQAVRWYELALPFLNRSAPSQASRASAYHGERLVSMGVSYWNVGAGEEAIQVTESGLEMMQSAAHAGVIKEGKLAVPYGNLASMYEAIGEPEKARKMSVLASKLQRRATR